MAMIRRHPKHPARRPFTPTVEPLEARALLTGLPLGANHFTARLVGQVYQDMLGRDVDEAGMTFWTRAIDQGVPRDLLVQAIQASGEFRTGQIQDAYQDFLGRPAEAASVDAYLQFLAAGGNLDHVRGAVLGSEEYYLGQGDGTAAGFLRALYEDVLHRELDATGGAYWQQVVTAGVPRGTVAYYVSTTAEAATARVNATYEALLDRPADPAALTLAPSLAPDALPPLIVASPEYYTRIRNLEADAPAPTQFGSAEAFQQFVVEETVNRWRGALGQSFPNNPYPDLVHPAVDFLAAGAPSALAMNAAPTSAVAADFSRTNVQVAGVDEADRVKTDGETIFILSGEELVAVSALPADDLQVQSRTRPGGFLTAQFLDGDRLTVISQEFSFGPVPFDTRLAVGAPTGLIAPGFFPGPPQPIQPPRTHVTVYDISDPAAPVQVQQTTLDGNYVNGRAVGKRITLVVQNDLVGGIVPRTTTDGTTTLYETEAEFRARLLTTPVDDLLPQVRYITGDGETVRPLADAAQIYEPKVQGDTNLISVVTFDAGADTSGPLDSADAVGSYATTVYATAEHLVLVTPRWSPDGGWTGIDRYTLAPSGQVDLTSHGEVPGQVINQFALDESDGHLRVATTVNDGPHTSSGVYVLADDGGSLEVTGRIEGLAPDERIFAVRFLGDRGFVVTFRQTDPLFALDLSDPTAPTVAGELHIPGFSRYLQPIDETHLLGVGRDADPLTGRQEELQVSLFDVADLANPTLVDRYSIEPSGWTWSGAEWDHHAVGFFPESGVLTIPVEGSGPILDPSSGNSLGFSFQSNLYVFDVDVGAGAGFDLLGRIEHGTTVDRSLRIGDVLYSVAQDTVQAHPLLEPERLLDEVRFASEALVPPGGPVMILPAAI